jgi:hypothetical protein
MRAPRLDGMGFSGTPFNTLVLVFVASTLFAVGLGTTGAMLRLTLGNAWLLISALAVNLLLIPAVGWGLAELLAPSRPTFIALVLAGASPGGPFGAKLAQVQLELFEARRRRRSGASSSTTFSSSSRTSTRAAGSTQRHLRRSGSSSFTCRPSSAGQMVSSGLVIRNSAELADRLRAEAQAVVDAGPPAVDDEELALRRYGVTDGLDDVRGDPEGDETLLTAANLAREVAELHLTLASAWIGTRKWLLRQLRETNPAFADRFVSAIRAHAGGDVTPLMALAEDVLEASGGRLFDGYRASGKAVLEKFENDAGRRSSS